MEGFERIDDNTRGKRVEAFYERVVPFTACLINKNWKCSVTQGIVRANVPLRAASGENLINLFCI